ncbi:MAG: WecB/TagA/CpsF family glycosyltransferase [Firmicutes bacterium]|nr:WecB/TagA/CpsF family glycosyltransferase [Bacillota bacterium]
MEPWTLRETGEGRVMVEILGVTFCELTEDEVFAACTDYIASGAPHVIITAGPEFVMRLQREPSLFELTRRADLVTPDGIGIVLAAKWRGRPLPERVTGVELALRLLAAAAGHQWRVYLLGASETSLQGALEALRVRYPELLIQGRNGYFKAAEEADVVAAIQAFRPDLLLVGLGQPRQDVFIDRYRDQLAVPLAMGVGGTIDIISGTVERAPVWAQRMKVEWLYRLVREPKRLRRQLVLPQFAFAAWREGRALRRK